MDVALKPPRKWRSGLFAVALTPVVPQLLGSIFNVWYNAAVVVRLLSTPELKHTFLLTCVLYNLIVYPVAIWVWLRCVWSLRPVLGRLAGGEFMPEHGAADWARRRVIDLPWRGAAVAGSAWLLCIPVFLLALWGTDHHLDPRLWWHISVSFLVSAFISVTHSFFLIELVCHKTLFPVFFRDARADQVPGARALSVTARGVIWAVSAGLCPIGSLLLLALAPAEPGKHELWLAIFVGVVGIAFGLCTAVMIMRFLSEPLGHLRRAAHAVAQGRLDVQVELRRADEFGVLIEEFNQMIRELREKERLRRAFGLHVGRQAAEEILARDPGLSGIEEEITVMFADIRSFTERSAGQSAAEMVEMLNGFLQVMVRVVEGAHGGMVNKFLGDGFIALFGVGGAAKHAQAAVDAAREMVQALGALNVVAPRGREPIAIGIGLHTGRAVVGSIGSPERLEFTAIGSTVNLASRIEGLTKSLGATLLITEATWRGLTNREGFVELPPQRVRGVEDLVKVYALGLPAPERSAGDGEMR